jgi:hypothetical protein
MTPYFQGYGIGIIQYSLFYGKHVFCPDFPEEARLWFFLLWGKKYCKYKKGLGNAHPAFCSTFL